MMVGRMLGPPVVQFAHGNAPLVSVDQSSAVGITLQLLWFGSEGRGLPTYSRSNLLFALRGGRPTRSLPREDIVGGNRSANCATRARPIRLGAR